MPVTPSRWLLIEQATGDRLSGLPSYRPPGSSLTSYSKLAATRPSINT